MVWNREPWLGPGFADQNEDFFTKAAEALMDSIQKYKYH